MTVSALVLIRVSCAQTAMRRQKETRGRLRMKSELDALCEAWAVNRRDWLNGTMGTLEHTMGCLEIKSQAREAGLLDELLRRVRA